MTWTSGFVEVRDWEYFEKVYDEPKRVTNDTAKSVGLCLLDFLLKNDPKVPVFDSNMKRQEEESQVILMTPTQLFGFYKMSPEAEDTHVRLLTTDQLKK